MRLRHHIVASVVAAFLTLPAILQAQDRVVVDGLENPNRLDLFVINFGLEANWGYLHPGGPGFERSMEAFGYDPIFGLFNMNVVGEVLFRLENIWEVGPHLAYNGIFTHTGDEGRDFDLDAFEFGGAARLVFGNKGDLGLAGLRLEGGFIRSNFTIDGESETSYSFFVRPAISVGTVGSGIEFNFGWTFSMVPDGFGTEDILPLGGLDTALLIRIAP